MHRGSYGLRELKVGAEQMPDCAHNLTHLLYHHLIFRESSPEERRIGHEGTDERGDKEMDKRPGEVTAMNLRS